MTIQAFIFKRKHNHIEWNASSRFDKVAKSNKTEKKPMLVYNKPHAAFIFEHTYLQVSEQIYAYRTSIFIKT